MRKEEKIRIRHGQCFGQIQRKESTNYEEKFEPKSISIELGEKSINQIVELIGEKLEEKKNAEVESELNVIATAALQESVKEELADTSTEKEDADKLKRDIKNGTNK